MIIDDEGKGYVTFREFYDLIKYANIFETLASHSIYKTRLYAKDIKMRSSLIRSWVTHTDQNDLE
jgi:hypothetical protein